MRIKHEYLDEFKMKLRNNLDYSIFTIRKKKHNWVGSSLKEKTMKRKASLYKDIKKQNKKQKTKNKLEN